MMVIKYVFICLSVPHIEEYIAQVTDVNDLDMLRTYF